MEKQKNCSKPKSKAKNQPTKKTNIGLITYAIVVLLLVAIGIGIWQAVVNKDKLTNKFKQITTTTATAPEMAQCAGCEHSHNDYGKDLNIANNPTCNHFVEYKKTLINTKVIDLSLNKSQVDFMKILDMTQYNFNIEINADDYIYKNFNIAYSQNNVLIELKGNAYEPLKICIKDFKLIENNVYTKFQFYSDNKQFIEMDKVSYNFYLTDKNGYKICLNCYENIYNLDCKNHNLASFKTTVKGQHNGFTSSGVDKKTYNFRDEMIDIDFKNNIYAASQRYLDSKSNNRVYFKVTLDCQNLTGFISSSLSLTQGYANSIFNLEMQIYETQEARDTACTGIVNGGYFLEDISRMRNGSICYINEAYFSTINISYEIIDYITNETICPNCFKASNSSIQQPQALPTATADIALNKIKGLEPLSIYLINNVEKTADANGSIAIEKIWYNKSINIIKKGNEALANSEAQVLAIPAEPTPDPTPVPTPDPKPDVKPDPTPEVKPDPKPSDPVITAPTTPSDTQLVMDWFKNYWIWIVVGFGTLIALSVGLPLIKKMVR